MPLQWSDEGERTSRKGGRGKKKIGTFVDLEFWDFFVNPIMFEVFRFCGYTQARSLGELGTDIDFLPGLLGRRRGDLDSGLNSRWSIEEGWVAIL